MAAVVTSGGDATPNSNAPFFPSNEDIDRMMNRENWTSPGITDNFFKNFIGLFGVNYTTEDRYFFWHSFVSIEGKIPQDVDVSILYQMGDKDSDWEGVHIIGVNNDYAQPQNMLPISLSNAGWNVNTPEKAGTQSSFNGVYYPDFGRI